MGIEEANWLPRIEAVQNCLKSWRHRTLSFKGKTFVLNALALSKIWYVGSLVEMPPWAKLQLDKLVYDYMTSCGTVNPILSPGKLLFKNVNVVVWRWSP